MTNIGRPQHTEEQYQTWLDDMSPFLRAGYSLHYAMDKALILRHKDSIYEKYRLHDWFSEKIDAYRRYPGEIVNSIFTRLVMSIDEKVKQGRSVDELEWRNLRFFAEKHRSCQPFFVTRQETAQVEPNSIGQILDVIEQSNYEELGRKASEHLGHIRTQTNALQAPLAPVQP